MCGIAGFRDLNGTETATRLHGHVDAMVRTLRHRGPDDAGVWVDESVGVGLGFSRLAIIDLSTTGRQPMVARSAQLVLTFNGEIYNHHELRKELARGHQFAGHSDTEVMLRAFEVWGVQAALSRMAGMFAFALWDRESRTLTLGRDRVGEKPLYYGWLGRTFAYASELKALRALPGFRGEVDRDALIPYLRHGWIPSPHSIYRGIYKLLPGTFLTLTGATPGELPSPQPYWSLREQAERARQETFEGSESEALTELEALLGRVVREQMVADVPLGAFLSGGVDSSTIVALMQASSTRRVKTFSIGFDVQGYDEAPHAAAVASHIGSDHTEMYVTSRDLLAVIPRLPAMNDEPFGDVSQIPVHLVSSLARQSVAVSLSGDGGDELFGGYGWYTATESVWSAVRWIPRPARRLLGRLTQAAGEAPVARRAADRLEKVGELLRRADSPEAIYQQLTSKWSNADTLVTAATEPHTIRNDPERWPDATLAEQLMYVDFGSYLPDNHMVKVDRASMAVSLEVRAPLLDHRVAEFAFRLPRSLKVKSGEGKYLLRQLLYRHVPRAIVDRPKMGFPVPLGGWLRTELRDWAEALLDERRLRTEAFFDAQLIRRRWLQHVRGERNWQFGLWHVLMFQAWLATAER